MNNELENVEVVVVEFKLLYRNLCAVTEENHGKSVRIIGAPTEIRTGYLRSASQKHFRSAKLTQSC
jgi:hypothetical protein